MELLPPSAQHGEQSHHFLTAEEKPLTEERIVGYVVQSPGFILDVIQLKMTSSSVLKQQGIPGKQINRTVLDRLALLGHGIQSCRSERLSPCMLFGGYHGLDRAERGPLTLGATLLGAGLLSLLPHLLRC